MGEFRQWLHEKVFVRLDGAHERRTVATLVALMLFGVVVGPVVLKAQTAQPQITVVEFSSDTLPLPVALRATAVGAEFKELFFQIYKSGQTSAPFLEMPAVRDTSAVGLWTSHFTAGEPGQKYFIRARGMALSGTAPIFSSNAPSVTILPPPTSACEKDEWACAEWSACTASGSQARSCTMTFDCPVTQTPPPEMARTCTPPPPTGTDAAGTCTQDIWNCEAWSACSSSGRQDRVCTMTFDCPVATTAAPTTTQTCTPTATGPVCGNQLCEADKGETNLTCANDCPATAAAPPTVFLAVPAVTAGSATVFLHAEGKNGTFSGLTFEITGSGGFVKTIESFTVTPGVWDGKTDLPPGAEYAVVAKGKTASGTEVLSNRQTLTVAPKTSTTAPEAAVPSLELLTPPAGAFFSGPVPLLARVLNGKAVKTVFHVRVPDNTTADFLLVVGNYDAAVDRWRGYFEGKTGKYLVAAEATLDGGKTVISAFHDFAVGAVTSETTAPTGTDQTSAGCTRDEWSCGEWTACAEGGKQTRTCELKFDCATAATPKPTDAQGCVPTATVAPTTEAAAAFDVERCVLGHCEPYSKRCLEIAGTDAAIRTQCQTAAASCIAACKAGRTMSLPAFPAPKAVETVKPPETGATETVTVPKTEPARTTAPEEPKPQPETASTETAPTPPAPERLKEFIIPPSPITPTPSVEVAKECVENSVSAERCSEWLAAKYRNPECYGAGLLTREACEAHLKAKNQTVDERSLSGFASAEKLEEVRRQVVDIYTKSTAPEDVPADIKEVLTVEIRPEEKVFILPPAPPKDATREVALGFVIVDSDADGLPDEAEARYGTDPRKADTDGDGYADGAEIKNGYNPLGAGKLGEKDLPAPIEVAILNNAPLEEPRAAEEGKLDASFVVEAAKTEGAPPTEAGAPEDGVPVLTLSGKAAPNAVVTIYVYSFLPVVVTTTTDANGNWKYDFHSKLAEGRHEAYVAINDETGKIEKTSNPLTFFVREASAATEADFLRADVNVEETPLMQSRLFLLGGSLLVLFAGLLVIMIVRQVRRGGGPEGLTP